MAFLTEDGAVILLHYTGLVEQTDAFVAASENGTAMTWDDHYMRMAMISTRAIRVTYGCCAAVSKRALAKMTA
jgi:hypothetical protein